MATPSASATAGLQPEKCLDYLQKLQDADRLSMFAAPVDPKEIPEYTSVISSPMDLSTIKKNLLEGKYKMDAELEDDVTLMIANALEFNPKDSEFYAVAKNLRQHYHSLAVASGLNVDADTAYIPTKRFRDDEASFRKAEKAAKEDFKEVLVGLSEDQSISLEDLRKRYKRDPQAEIEEEDEASSEGSDNSQEEEDKNQDEDESDDDDEESDDDDDDDDDDESDDDDDDEESDDDDDDEE